MRPLRIHDPGLGALHHHDDLQRSRCVDGRAQRIGLDLIPAAIQQLGHLTGMGRDDGPASESADVGRVGTEPTEGSGIEDEGGGRVLLQQSHRQNGRFLVLDHAGSDQDGIAALRHRQQPIEGALGLDAARWRFRQADDHGFGNREGQGDGHAADGGDLQLARAGPESRDPCQEGGPGHFRGAAEDEGAAAFVLAALMGDGKPKRPEPGEGEALRFHHRAATFASGSEVTGAPASNRGATKL